MDSNSVASLPSVRGLPVICTLCGLMCELGPPASNQCNRLDRWVAAAPSRAREQHASDVSQRLASVKLDAGTLIWLDACDVQTTRAAVRLARQVGATIHVGQSAGAHAVKCVITSDGWLGTTLSELSARAELIVTLGDGVFSESPLLAERFFHSPARAIQADWIHISQHASEDNFGQPASGNTNTNGSKNPVTPRDWIHWPREQWFERLSQLAISVQPAAVPTLADLSARLLASIHSVWVWDVDDFGFERRTSNR
jgi:hypothetical protein